MDKDDGLTRSNIYNLVVIELKSDVRMSNNVMPVFIDWIIKFTVQNGLVGKLASWGDMNNMAESSVLSLPYIDRQTCLQMYENVFKNNLTTDTFCAGSKSGGTI
ncbi:Peptidase S1, PA clan,Serine proteases, trypsin domain [Cinara cedri]|uniref:Peptidase S1, PA clan,Serine proteases, trypsin domain n=1 Tax=Cinara cedri TaxID=506608 RepID=A0A5E4NGD2_9HEMI|nr:Peptidase S1, PA clan,Serine proteases, trypsin domain [Cinara cedri]